MIIGVDYHPSFQTIAFFMEETGECGEQELNHSDLAALACRTESLHLTGKEDIFRQVSGTRDASKTQLGLIGIQSVINSRSRCPRPRARVFGSAHGIDGFWVRLRAAQLSTAANPAKGPPVAPCIIISSQTAVVRDSQHSRAIVHVHRFHCVCQRLILILVDQHGAFRVVHVNHCGATA
jgi:hypothetical protein